MLVTFNGESVLAGAITIPVDGAWHATLDVDTSEAPTGAVVLDVSDGALVLSGTVTRSSSFRERVRVELVGGAGKLGALLPAKAYRNVPSRVVLVDALLSAGERLSPYSDTAVLARALPRWVRPAGRLRDTLTGIVAGTPGAVWRVRADGAVWVGVPTWPLELIDYELHDADATARKALIMTDDFAALDAGISLDGQHVLEVRHVLDASGIQTEVTLAP